MALYSGATPMKTPAEIHADLSLTGGRISLALRELKRRLEIQMPLQIAYANTQMGLAADKGIPTFKGIAIAPAKINDKFINHLLIGASVRKESEGAGAFHNDAVISFYLVNRRIDGPSDVDDAWDRSDLVAAVLLPYLGGCTDPQGRLVWTVLAPLEQTMLPEEWEQYSGVALNYRLIQEPTEIYWLPAE
jgi:hypothetical protein